MGFILSYKRFISLRVQEQSGKVLKGFTFFPTEDCLAQLKNYRLVLRIVPGGFAIYYADLPLVPIQSRVKFTFGFALAETRFFEKYGLTDAPETGYGFESGLFFDNLTSGGSVITENNALLTASGTDSSRFVTPADTFEISRQTFKVFLSPGGGEPSKYTLSPWYEPSEEQENQVDSYTGEYAITTINSVDLKEDYFPKPGPYLLKTDSGNPNQWKVYLHEELTKKGAQGVVDLFWESSQETVPDENGLDYLINFKPKT